MKSIRPKFSVITPVHLWSDQRVTMFLTCIESLKKQTIKDFEWIVVDDGSTLPFLWDKIREIHADFPVKFIHSPHEERVISYNSAFQMADGEWFVLLDSDDELRADALERMFRFIEAYPSEKMFNFGCIYQHKDGGRTLRDPFMPQKAEEGHEKFGGGTIVNGTFIWNREVYKKLGAYPPSHLVDINCSDINYGGIRELYMGSPYDFSAAAQLEFPEIREYFMVNHESEPNKIIKELGNPWGQDYYLFYKYTRKYQSKPINEHLYIVHPR
jgi:glycosyltransferase involved in cell wall biosynthesis